MRTTKPFMWLFLLVLPASVRSLIVPTPDVCESARRVGVNMTLYAQSVAHSLHSLSVEDIRYFFDEQFPIDNSVPTINFDLTSKTNVLPYAPSRPSVFKFPGGAWFDYIINNNDKPEKFGSRGLTNLEELAHQMHMLEMWHHASIIYKDIATKNINTEEVCPCLVNEQKNEIFARIEEYAKLFKIWFVTPVIDGVRTIPARHARCGLWTIDQGITRPTRGRRDTEEADNAEELVAHGVVLQTIGGKKYQIVPELTDSKSWNSYWQATVVSTKNDPDSIKVRRQSMFNFAMYMYCKINM
jgi:hypothetical protein